MNQDVKDLVEDTKDVLEVLSNDKRYFELQAKQGKNLHEAFVNEGFSHMDALQLTIAVYQSGKK